MQKFKNTALIALLILSSIVFVEVSAVGKTRAPEPPRIVVSLSNGSSQSTGSDPTISLPASLTAVVGQTLSFPVRAVDSAGSVAAVAATGLPVNASFDSNSGTLTFTPSSDQNGQTVAFTFTSGTSTATVLCQVVIATNTSAIAPPIISVPQGPVVVQTGSTGVFQVAGNSSAGGCVLTLSASPLPANATFDASSGTFGFSPATDQEAQDFYVTFTARDCANRSVEETVPVIVAAASPTTTPTGNISIPPAKIEFGKIAVGEVSPAVTITLLNLGSGDLNISSISLATSTEYNLIGPQFPLRLTPGASVQVEVAFQPQRTGDSSDKLTIISSDPKYSSVTVQLSGKAKAPPKVKQ